MKFNQSTRKSIEKRIALLLTYLV